ncbi:MAG TPA: hypothetical protein VFE06_13885 [Acidobacteriaceae bacterium]|jgi:hypothetical protein|nr:hypothetical protein [Acidobacteriaceae bacterium]
MQKKNRAKKGGAKERVGTRTAAKQHAGGREFGNVIEPMQAEMASENKGLAADFGSNSSRPERNMAAHSRRSAA